MKRYLFLATFCFFLLSSAEACINETRMKLNGESYHAHHRSMVPYGKDYGSEYYKKEHKGRSEEYYAAWQKNHKLDDYSDYGAMLVYLGEYEKAKSIFIEIEGMEPDRYSTAANLGTIYELLGENTLALEWIKKAVSIDPMSHGGSEWLHVKILEAKVGGSQHINAKFITGIDFGKDSIPSADLDSAALIKFRDALYYQLRERMSFIKPQDKIVALLLFQLGNVVAITDDVTTALRIYDVAIKYGYSSEILDLRYYKFKTLHGPVHRNSEEHISTKAKAHKIIPPKTLVVRMAVTPPANYTIHWLAGIFLVVIAVPIGVACFKK